MIVVIGYGGYNGYCRGRGAMAATAATMTATTTKRLINCILSIAIVVNTLRQKFQRS